MHGDKLGAVGQRAGRRRQRRGDLDGTHCSVRVDDGHAITGTLVDVGQQLQPVENLGRGGGGGGGGLKDTKTTSERQDLVSPNSHHK